MREDLVLIKEALAPALPFPDSEILDEHFLFCSLSQSKIVILSVKLASMLIR